MDIPETVSVRKFHGFNAKQKHKLYETLLELAEAIEELPKKSLRKTLELTFAVLEYKGGQADELQRKLDERSGTDAQASERRLSDENEKLQRMLEKLEAEKENYKDKVKELTDELLLLQKRLHEAVQQADASDKDSSDPLSELDKQEELLRNINTKNKHIKRLLREIETLQNQNVEQSKTISTNERELLDIRAKMLQLSSDISLVDNERKLAKQREHELANEVTRLEGNLTYLEEERERNQKEMQILVSKTEARKQSLKQLLAEKDKELNRLRREEKSTLSYSAGSNISESTSNGSASEKTKMRHLLEVRNKRIEELEAKLHSVAEEMISSTDLMNKLSAERLAELDPQKPRLCCQVIEEHLRVANERCQQLSELLERTEEDNMVKSKQALHSISALEAFKRGEDGLIPALKKCAVLEQKLAAREKDLRGYILELNSMHEIMQENSVLRKRLKIPEDVVVTAKNLAAKERNKEKIIERLTLKLRTSEELRLQLKLEKSQLRKEVLCLEKRVGKKSGTLASVTNDGPSLPSEIGEVPESTTQAHPEMPHMCGQCRGQGDGAASTELQTRYEEVLAENETLRVGMYEILEKLRDYNASSDFITIDGDLLRRLIEALPSRSPSNTGTPQRLQNELGVLKAREEALRELLRRNQTQQSEETETGELSSVQSMRDISDISQEDIIVVDSATRPTTPNKMLDESQLPMVNGGDVAEAEYNALQQRIAELEIYRKHYDELRLHLGADGNELLRINQELTQQLANAELSLLQQNRSYAYMRAEYDELLSSTRQQELRYITDTAALKREVEESQMASRAFEALLADNEDRLKYNKDEYQQLEQRNVTLSMQLAHLVDDVLSGRTNANLKPVQDICLDYGIIKDDYQLDYVTAAEYQAQSNELSGWRQKQGELQRQNKQLAGLLEVANDQIRSQQKLLNEITDNHINLRHVVADLQSTTDEKFLLAKIQRDLDATKLEYIRIELERNELQAKVTTLQAKLQEAEHVTAQTQKDSQNERKNREIKFKFLQKSIFALREKYAKFTPLVFLTNFVFAYTKFASKPEVQRLGIDFYSDETLQEKLNEVINSKLAEGSLKSDDSEHLIKTIKAETQAKLIEENYQLLQVKYAQLQNELLAVRLKHATETEHWQTIAALFGSESSQEAITYVNIPAKAEFSEATMKVIVDTNDVATNTEVSVSAPVPAVRRSTSSRRASVEFVDKQSSPIGTPTKRDAPSIMQTEIATQTAAKDAKETGVQTSTALASQAVQTVTEEVGAEAKQLQQALQAANARIAELEKLLDQTQPQQTADGPTSAEAGVVEKTILSFHMLLMEKDNAIKKHQDLLQSEREQNQVALAKQSAENEAMGSTINNLNFNIKTKDIEILELKAKLEVLSTRRSKRLNRAPIEGAGAVGIQDSDESGCDNSLNELTDEKLEEMFEDTTSVGDRQIVDAIDPIACEAATDEKEKQDTEELKEVPTLIKQIKELKEKICHNEKMLKSKEEEISILREKLKLCQEREKSLEGGTNPEIEQLRLLLEEKDKHISDLMDTLKNFHDDQQRYMNDTSNYSADQITKLAVDLNRTEATNKIYQTQVEALRRQLASLGLREKQARELNQSLRSQLIKRPVVSIKTELNARVKNENLQKRIQQLELDLDETRAQLKRQETLLDAKRARSANEVGLWEKQKRWQQNAEKFKSKLEETECTLEKTRSLLQAARTTIRRMEKDKHVLEMKSVRSGVPVNHTQPVMRNTMKCCRTPSCPNLQHVGAKFTPTPSESPETCTGPSSECSSPVNSAQPAHGSYFERNQPELLEALKARIELQQRKIIAMELAGKGSNALTTELEKLQERCQMIESQNLRLESKNLELQLENNVVKQSDITDRQQKRIKHLEDYIIALKEEMARLDSRRDLCKCSGIKVNTQQGQSAEHTILSLRNLVEKLRAENKYLKDGRRSTESRSSVDSTPAELCRLQESYANAMQKLATVQEELRLKAKCSVCNGRAKDATNEELKYIKDQLIKKTQLLQKAKVLLTRAAAKEKVLKEQLVMWKRKCSELQNVPVIDEISE